MPDGPDLVEAARALQPLVREHASEAEHDRTVPRKVVDAMAGAGLFRVCVAREHGGFECDPETTVRVIEAVSEADGSTGWALMIGIETMGIASGWAPGSFGRELFSEPGRVMGGALNPLGRAMREPGGWRLNGRWPFISGSPHADWLLLGGVLHDESGESLHRSHEFYVPRGSFEIIDTWSVAGLRGSGSHDVEVRDLFVPADHTTSILFGPALRSGTLFRYPVMPRLAYNKVGVATGIARAAIEAFKDLAGAKKPLGSRALLRERNSAQLQLAEAEWQLEAGRALVFSIARETWASIVSGEELSPAQRARLRIACSGAVAAAVKAVELVYAAAGSSANYMTSPLERQFRDVHVVPMHATVNAQLMEAAGRSLLGLDPGLPTF